MDRETVIYLEILCLNNIKREKRDESNRDVLEEVFEIESRRIPRVKRGGRGKKKES